jgi:5-methyltetrahydrofolate--homocysteine methyltransferase
MRGLSPKRILILTNRNQGVETVIEKDKFYAALSEGNAEEIKKLTQDALDAGEKPETVLNDGLVSSMERLGVLFKNNEIYIPEVLIAARAMHAGMAILKPILSKATTSQAAKVLVGTVAGDLHDIGKNLVIMMLEGGGFNVVDLGVDCAADKFIEAIRTQQPQVVGLSALLTTTMERMKNTIEAITSAGLRDKIKIVVGGAPVTENFASSINADGYAPDGASAVDAVKSLLAN